MSKRRTDNLWAASAWAERVTREMLEAASRECDDGDWTKTTGAARAILEREVRAFVGQYADEVADVLEGDYARWLDSPTPEAAKTFGDLAIGDCVLCAGPCKEPDGLHTFPTPEAKR